jgi:electron transfer flavoprotein alpha subunit
LTQEDLKDPVKAMARIQAGGDDFLKIPQEIGAEAELLMADLKALERESATIANGCVAVVAKKTAAETLAVAFLRDEPSMAPDLAAKLRAKFASDCPEVYLRIQELSLQQE